MRGITLDKVLLPWSLTFFALQVSWGPLVSAITYVIFASLQLGEFSADSQDSGL